MKFHSSILVSLSVVITFCIVVWYKPSIIRQVRQAAPPKIITSAESVTDTPLAVQASTPEIIKDQKQVEVSGVDATKNNSSVLPSQIEVDPSIPQDDQNKLKAIIARKFIISERNPKDMPRFIPGAKVWKPLDTVNGRERYVHGKIDNSGNFVPDVPPKIIDGADLPWGSSGIVFLKPDSKNKNTPATSPKTP
jgi:hypothetical protein